MIFVLYSLSVCRFRTTLKKNHALKIGIQYRTYDNPSHIKQNSLNCAYTLNICVKQFTCTFYIFPLYIPETCLITSGLHRDTYNLKDLKSIPHDETCWAIGLVNWDRKDPLQSLNVKIIFYY